MRRSTGVTLTELVIVMVVVAVLSVAAPPLLVRGVHAMVFLPRAIAANHTALEALHQVVEGGFSTLPGASWVPGLRFATRRVPQGQTALAPAIWLAETHRIGYLASDGRFVLIRLDIPAGIVWRSLPPVTATCATIPSGLTEEGLPYEAGGRVQIATTGQMFRYYNQAGGLVEPSCPPSAAIRRVEVLFTSQTGNALFDEGQASEPVISSAAIRIP